MWKLSDILSETKSKWNIKSKQIVLASGPYGLPSSENFRFEERETGKLNRTTKFYLKHSTPLSILI
jgi:hypothetical protein